MQRTNTRSEDAGQKNDIMSVTRQSRPLLAKTMGADKQALLDALQDALSLLAQLNHVLPQLDRPWRKALLDRTRLSDLGFLGEVLAVITMCSTGLRSGMPLPQITPSPLVARFRMGKTKGVDIPADPHAHSNDLPSLVTVDGKFGSPFFPRKRQMLTVQCSNRRTTCDMRWGSPPCSPCCLDSIA